MPILRDCAIYYGGYDLTSTANSIEFDASCASVDLTTFGSAGAHVLAAGLRDGSANVTTFLDTATSEAALKTDNVGQTELLTAVAFPTGGTVTAGDRCYAMRGLLKSSKTPRKVGEAEQIEAMMPQAQREGVLGGTVILAPVSVNSSGTGSVLNLGAVAAGQTVYFGVHVIASSGNRTITPVLQSASAAGFGTPTDRVTLSSISSVGASFGSSSTATTDAYWRISYTTGGSSGSVTVVAFAAIQQ